MPRWTAAKIQRLKADYHTIPGPQLATELGVSRAALATKAHRLGLSRRRTRWNDSMEETVRRRYGSRSNHVLARTLNISRDALERKAKRLGMTRARRWTPEQDRFLTGHIYEHTIAWVIKHMPGPRRSPRAVRCRLRQLGIDPQEARVRLTYAEAGELAGVTADTVGNWVRRGWLKATKDHLVHPRDLRAFLINNPDRVNWHRIGEVADMLVGLLAARWGVAKA